MIATSILLASCSSASSAGSTTPSRAQPSPMTAVETATPAAIAENEAQATDMPDYWPTTAWRTSTPEAQGMESATLSQMLQLLKDEDKNINSMLIVRHGTIVLEAYFAPYDAETRHDLYSATKSVTSALIGLAIQDGNLNGVHERVLEEIFPELQVENLDQRKRRISIEHLLEMSAGLKWSETSISYGSASNPVIQMHRSEDWVKFVLDQPMAYEPGTRFSYNSGASHLLSAILHKRTGLLTATYAEQSLFQPLGFSDYYWPADPAGIHTGSSGLQLIPRDMARIGYLYLQDGLWEGQRLLPQGWVEESTRKRQQAVSASDLRYRLLNAITRLFRPGSPEIQSMDYGYHWWLPSFGGYAARGWAGQAIFVMPDLDLVVVFSGGLSGADNFLPDKLMVDYIIPSIQSGEPLAEDQDEVAQLDAIVSAIKQPEPQEVPPLPAMARLISGKTFKFEAPQASIQSLVITFAHESEARLSVIQGNTQYEVWVGLDNTFRTNPISERETIALRGYWSDETTFVLDWRALSSGDRSEIVLTFTENQVEIRSQSKMTGRSERMQGKLQD